MKGSVAFWYEPRDAAAPAPPQVELHFNLWRDLILRGSNYLDVGILFKSRAKATRRPPSKSSDAASLAESVESFFMFLPGNFRREQIADLSVLMEHGSTLNAVFNDVVVVTERHDRYFKTQIGGRPHLQFHNLNIDEDIELRTIETSANELGTILVFKRSFCTRCDQAGDHYLRFRLVLDDLTRDIFTSDLKPSDWFLLSSFSRIELTEFRLNERRSFPAAVAERANRFFEIVTVHYFLMRDLKFELLNAHTDFRKMRRLEEELWRHYLKGTPPGRDPGWRISRALARGAGRRMIIYHWRVGGPGKPVDDFIALASFRFPIPNLLIYAVAIGLLGGAGNAFYGIALWALQAAFDLQPTNLQSILLTNIAAAILLIALALGAILTLSKTSRAVKWLWDYASERYWRFGGRRRP